MRHRRRKAAPQVGRNLVSSRIMRRKWLEAIRAYFPSTKPGYGSDPFPYYRRQLARGCLHRGNAFFRDRQYDRALEQYNQAIDWSPEVAEAFCNRACVYLEKAEYELALTDSDRAILLNPSLASAVCNRGNALLGKGELGQAVSNYEQAMHLKPDYALPFANRAFVRLLEGRMEDVIKDCDHAIELDPNFAIAYSNRGAAAFCQANFEKAAKDFALAAKHDPANCAQSIWVYLAKSRDGCVEPAYLERLQAETDLTAWPGPVIRFLLGALTVDALLTGSQEKNAKKHQQQSCEAFFFAGEREWLEGRPEQAAAYFVRAIEVGATSCAEFVAAQSELRLVRNSG